MLKPLSFLFCACSIIGSAHATEASFMIAELESGKIIASGGNTQEAYSPCSTFKIPLALMGFNENILINPQSPVWPYKIEYADPRPEIHKDINPKSWLAESAVWYSRVLTQKLGEARFKQYVDSFAYGNQDISGDPRKNNGLAQAWLSSSLKISPEGQINFLRNMLLKKLSVSEKALQLTQSAMPVFSLSNGWTIYGKTGSGPLQDKEGKQDPNNTLGWFVGWAKKADQILVFAHLLPSNGNGIKSREQLFSKWEDYTRTANKLTH